MIRARYFIILVLLIVAGANTATARRAADFFTSAPDRIVRLLPQSTRLDMVDYFNYGSSHLSDNFFGGKARITALSDTTVSLVVDADVSMQFAVLPAASDTVIAVITTLALPVSDSAVKFYTTDWRPAVKTGFDMPPYTDWLTPEGKKKIDEITLHLQFIPVEAAFTTDGSQLILTNQARNYLSSQQFEEFAPYLIDEIVFDVKGARLNRRQ